MPALEVSHKIDFNCFSTKNIIHLKKVCDASRLADLTKNEAVIYVKLLKKAGLHCLDSFYAHMGMKDESFWMEVLTTVYEFPMDLAQIVLKNKDSMMTTAVYDYLQQFKPPNDFFERVAKFQRMTYQELVELGEFSIDYMMDIFLELMPSHIPQEFSAFSLATRVLKNYKAPI